MSNELAIASVTYVLKDLLNDGLIDRDITGIVGGNVKITSLPPDRIDLTTANRESQLNLFMYRVSHNLGWSNVGLPARNEAGDRIANPPLALDLHYLLTAYGIDELHTEVLLGYGVQLLHDTPVLGREAIRHSMEPGADIGGNALPEMLKRISASQLADQIEQIKITPVPMNVEEISRVWSAFQSKYRPTVAYQASVVLMERRRSVKAALPVRRGGRRGYAFPFKKPLIEKILSQTAPGEPVLENAPILAGHRLVLIGKELQGERTRVAVSDHEITPAAEDISPTAVTVALPAQLKAGLQGVRVIHERDMGEPATPHRGVASDLVPFVLRPTLQVTGKTLTQGANGLYSGTVEVTVNPGVEDNREVVLLLNQISAVDPEAYSFYLPKQPPLSPPAPLTDFSVPVAAVTPGTYLARLCADGAQSPLTVDGGGTYNAPQVIIP